MKIHVYTDGCSKRNPGPSGAGVVIALYEYENEYEEVYEFSVFVGPNDDNNYAELIAAEFALIELLDGGAEETPIVLHTDSRYVIDAIEGKSEETPKEKHQESILRCRGMIAQLQDFQFKWVKGHNGNRGNELADSLANVGVRSWQFQNNMSDEMIADDAFWNSWLATQCL